MLLPRVCLLTGLVSFAVVATADAVGQAQSPAPAQEPPSFEPARDLSDALQRATAAVREAEERGPDSVAKFKEAQFYTREAFKFDPVNAKAEFISGRLNRLINRTRDAFSQVQKYVKTPEGSVDWEGFKVLGDLHYEGKYYVQADAKYRRAAQLAPGEPSVYIAWSRCNLKLAKRELAIRYARKAVELDPTSADPYEALAEALVEDKQFDEAKAATIAAMRQTRLQLRDNPADVQLLTRLQAGHQSLQGILTSLIRKDATVGAYYVEYSNSVAEALEFNRLITLHRLQFSLEQGIVATQPNTPPQLIERYAEVSAAVMKNKRAVEVLEKYLQAHPLDETATKAVEKLKAMVQRRSMGPPSLPAEPKQP